MAKLAGDHIVDDEVQQDQSPLGCQLRKVVEDIFSVVFHEVTVIGFNHLLDDLLSVDSILQSELVSLSVVFLAVLVVAPHATVSVQRIVKVRVRLLVLWMLFPDQ